MLDVHPPHHAAHGWRDFFIHIATITVGLLIAIGLEQTVEAIHRHHERAELREALDIESRQILLDTERVDTGETADLQWYKQVKEQISSAARNHQPLGSLPPRNTLGWDVPDEPVYKAAKASGKLALLTDEEVISYGELDSVMSRIEQKYQALTSAQHDLDIFARNAMYAQPAGTPLLTNLTPEQMQQLYEDFVAREITARDMRYWSRQARGAATALLAGERDLHKIETAERQFDKLP